MTAPAITLPDVVDTSRPGRIASLDVVRGVFLLFILLKHGGEPSWAVQAAERVDFLGHPRASFVIANVVAWAAIAAVLHRRRIYLRP